MTFATTLDGAPCQSVDLLVPSVGIWVAGVTTVEPWAATSPRASLEVGGAVLVGFVEQVETFAGRSIVTLVGGAEGWARNVPHQHHQGPVQLSSVVTQLASAAGESLIFDASLERELGADYVRPSGAGAGLLTRVLAGAPWWVDFAGVTHVGARPARDVTGRIEVLESEDGTAELGFVGELDDVNDVLPGCYLTDESRLGAGVVLTITESCVVSSSAGLRALCRVSRSSTAPAEPSRLAALVASMAAQSDPYRIHARGPFRYRVYDQSGDELRLQIVRSDLTFNGLPDILPVRMVPGVAGFKATLTPGAVVLLDFIEGDPTMPIVTHYSPSDDAGFLPVSIEADATTGIKLGSAVGRALRAGDLIKITGAVVAGVSGTVEGSIALGTSVVAPGIPGVGYSKVEL